MGEKITPSFTYFKTKKKIAVMLKCLQMIHSVFSFFCPDLLMWTQYKQLWGGSHRVLLGNDNHRTTMQGTVTFIQSEPAAHQFTRPYLRRASRWEALIGDGGGRRLIGRGSDPTAVLLEGGGLIQEDTFELFTLEDVLVSVLDVSPVLLDNQLPFCWH